MTWQVVLAMLLVVVTVIALLMRAPRGRRTSAPGLLAEHFGGADGAGPVTFGVFRYASGDI